MTPIEIEERLRQAYPQAVVAAIDLTGQNNHYEIRISTNLLNGLSRIEQHQAIMSLLEKELKSGEIHALSIKVLKN